MPRGHRLTLQAAVAALTAEVAARGASESEGAVRLPGLVVSPSDRQSEQRSDEGAGVPPSARHSPEVVSQFDRLEVAVREVMARTKCDWKAAVRRVLGTSENGNDPERMNAADAKRKRRRFRNAFATRGVVAAVYVGPEAGLRGTALLRRGPGTDVLAQFDDLTLSPSHGWRPFEIHDFELLP